MQIFKGVCTAIVTPFNENNKINFNVLKQLIEFQIKNGVSAIVFLGTTGEASTLTRKEKISIIKFAVKQVNKRVPVIIGAGGNNTKAVINFSMLCEKLGADALLEVTPYYNKCTQNGLILHYTAIANSVKIPIILYNVPSRTGVNILPETVLELSKIKNIVAIKEACGDLKQLTKLAQILPKSFAIYSGDDENIFSCLSLGGKGVISVISNVLPKETCQITELYFHKKINNARKIQFKLLDIIREIFIEVNPIPIKAALEMSGFQVGKPRLPLTPLSPQYHIELYSQLKMFNKNIY